MAIYKGTQALSMNGANGQNGANGANGYGIRCWERYNETHNEYEGESGSGYINSVSGSYSSCGGYHSACNGNEANFVFGYENGLDAAQGNSVLGFQNKLTHASQGCHTEGMWNWLKASQGAHLEGYDNKAQGGLGCHIEGYGHGGINPQTYERDFFALGAAQGIHVEGYGHTGIPSSGLKFGAHIGGMEVKPSSYLAGVTSGFFNGQNMELIGGQISSSYPGTQGGLIRQMDEFGNMAIAGNFGCWINSQYEGQKFVTIQEIYDMIIALNPPV